MFQHPNQTFISQSRINLSQSAIPEPCLRHRHGNNRRSLAVSTRKFGEHAPVRLFKSLLCILGFTTSLKAIWSKPPRLLHTSPLFFSPGHSFPVASLLLTSLLILSPMRSLLSFASIRSMVSPQLGATFILSTILGKHRVMTRSCRLPRF